MIMIQWLGICICSVLKCTIVDCNFNKTHRVRSINNLELVGQLKFMFYRLDQTFKLYFPY